MGQLLLQCLGTRVLSCGPLLGLAEFGLNGLQPPLQLLDLPPSLLEVGGHGFDLLPGAVDLAVSTILHIAYVALLGNALLLGLEPQRLQILLQCLILLLDITALTQQSFALLLQVLDLRLTLRQQQLEVGQSCLDGLASRHGLRRLLTKPRRILPRLLLYGGDTFAFGSYHLPLFVQRLFGHTLCQVNRLLPHRYKSLRHLARQCRQSSLAAQPLGQARPPLIEQTTHPRRTATAQLQPYALHRRSLATGQHRVRRSKHLVFRHPYCHGPPPGILGLIMDCYPTLYYEYWNYHTLNVLNITDQLPLVDETPLNPHSLAINAQEAAAAFLAAGTAANTVRSYRSALTYWSAWLQLRYGLALGDAPLPTTVAVQFVVDHLARPLADGGWAHLLPASIDAALVEARVKSKPGALAYNTVSHRLAVLGKWHRIKGWDSPTQAPALKTLLREARKAQSRQGVAVRKKTAIVLEPLQALLATCTDGVRGIRDRALLLLAWSGGGRRRSEVVGLQVGDVRQLDADTWLYALGATKTDTGGVRRDKPLRGPAAQALTAWLKAAPAQEGPLFRRMYKGGKVGTAGLSGDQVARIVQRRAKLAGLEGDWAAHSLRSGFVTEAGRQGVPLGEVMAMTEHRSVTTVMGYFQAGSLLNSRATSLLGDEEP